MANMFVNPDFDTDSDWAGGATWHEGTGGQDGGDYYSYGYAWTFYQVRALAANTWYYVSWWCKNETDADGATRLQIAQNPQAGAVLTSTQVSSDLTASGWGDDNVAYIGTESSLAAWKKFYGIFKTDSAGNHVFRFLQSGGSGTKAFDTVFLDTLANVGVWTGEFNGKTLFKWNGKIITKLNGV